VYSNTGYGNVYTAFVYKSFRWATQSQLYSLTALSNAFFGNIQRRYLKTNVLLALSNILAGANIDSGAVTEGCQNLYYFSSNLTQYINNSTSQLSAGQTTLLTNLNTNLSASTQQLCTAIATTVQSCSNNNQYDPLIAADMERVFSIIQNIFQTISIELGNVSSNTYTLASYTQISYQVLGLGFLNNTNDITTVIGFVNSTRIFYRNYWAGLYGTWRTTWRNLYGITENWISKSLNLTIYLNITIQTSVNSSITKGSNAIDGTNIDVFDCNYNYQNNIVTSINNIMVKLILEILAVSIVK
jgi:hypothetical protein